MHASGHGRSRRRHVQTNPISDSELEGTGPGPRAFFAYSIASYFRHRDKVVDNADRLHISFSRLVASKRTTPVPLLLKAELSM
jgi:hypothetical protein